MENAELTQSYHEQSIQDDTTPNQPTTPQTVPITVHNELIEENQNLRAKIEILNDEVSVLKAQITTLSEKKDNQTENFEVISEQPENKQVTPQVSHETMSIEIQDISAINKDNCMIIAEKPPRLVISQLQMQPSKFCLICLSNYIFPVELNCQHQFCQECLDLALKFNQNCPCCQQEITSQKPLPMKPMKITPNQLVLSNKGEFGVVNKIVGRKIYFTGKSKFWVGNCFAAPMLAQNCQFSTRISANSVVSVLSEERKKVEKLENIFKFQNNNNKFLDNFTLYSKQKTSNLVEIVPSFMKIENCPGCNCVTVNPVISTCSHEFCRYCAMKCQKYGIPCQICQKQVKISQKCTKMTKEIGEIVQYQNLAYFLVSNDGEKCVIRGLKGVETVVNIEELQEIDVQTYIRVLRPQNHDFILDLSNYDFSIYFNGYQYNIDGKHEFDIKNKIMYSKSAQNPENCAQCNQSIINEVQLACNHEACRHCSILSSVQHFPCFECENEINFWDVQSKIKDQFDSGTIVTKIRQTINHGQNIGFVKRVKNDKIVVSFSSGLQEIKFNELMTIRTDELKVKEKPLNGDLVVLKGDNQGVFGILIGKNKVLTEVGLKIDVMEGEYMGMMIER